MKTMIKKTFSIDLGREYILIALMQDLGFKEISRQITGGQMSAEKVQFVFEGWDCDYNENGYVKEDSEYGAHTYYSLRVLEGYYTNYFGQFKIAHDKRLKSFTVNHF